MSESAKPLAGLKVVELGTLIAGPFCTRILAEFGAEVIKIESPDGGDPLRKWRKLYEGTSLWWYVQGRNKKSVTANLKHPEGLAFVRRLIAGADILVENFRPGVLEKLGLSWESLQAENPGQVMVRLSDFGQTGPFKDQPGFRAVGGHWRPDGAAPSGSQWRGRAGGRCGALRGGIHHDGVHGAGVRCVRLH